MNYLLSPSSSFDGLEVYLKTLNSDQIKDLHRSPEELMATIPYQQQPILTQPDERRPSCPYPSNPMPRYLGHRQPPFNWRQVDRAVGAQYACSPQPSPCHQIQSRSPDGLLLHGASQINSFVPVLDDNMAVSMLADGPQISAVDEFWIENTIESLFNGNQQRTPFIQCAVDDAVRLTLDGSPLPSPSIYSELHYEENLLPGYYFGPTEVSHVAKDDQAKTALDFGLLLSPSSPPSIKKTRTKKSKPSRSPSPPLPNMNEFDTTDESGRRHKPLLYEFFRHLLNSRNYSNIATYVDKRRGIFKIHQRSAAANLWKHVKGRNSDSAMTYDKMARGLRYYYGSGIIQQTPGRFTFQFGPASGFGTQWFPA